MFKYHDLRMSALNLTNKSNFHPLEVGENLKYTIQRVGLIGGS